jgi:hypothetical protein
VDKRKVWREQEAQLVARWTAAEERHRQVHEEISRRRSDSEGDGPGEELALRAQAVRAEIEGLRREVARLKVQFNSGKRYSPWRRSAEPGRSAGPRTGSMR